jgi:hypothetical protein
MNTYIVLSLLFVGLNAFPMTPDSDSVGDVKDVDPNQPEVKEAISFAFNVIHDSIDSTHAITMGKVLKTQSQVVSGEKFYITLEVNETDCAKHVTDLKPCKVIVSIHTFVPFIEHLLL